jgi:hypothetical protein
MADLSKNRDSLFNIVKDFKVNVKKGTYTRAQFDKFFENETKFIELVNWLKDKIIYKISPFTKLQEKTTNEFYSSYVCGDTAISWAAKSTVCGGGAPPPPLVTKLDISDYIGTYKDNLTKAELNIADKDGTNLKLVAYGQSADVVFKANDAFDVLIDLKFATIKGTLEFKRDSKNKVTGFHYKFENVPDAIKGYLPANFQPEGDATKDLSTSTMSDFFKDTDNTGKWDYFMGKSSSPYPRQKKDSGTQQNTPPKQNIIKNEPYKVDMPDKIIPCDENAYNWGIGCQNNKIKALNLRVLGKELDGVYTNDLKRALINFGKMKDDNPVITKEIYDKIMSLNLQESIVKKVVLKNLKELLNKNL